MTEPKQGGAGEAPEKNIEAATADEVVSLQPEPATSVDIVDFMFGDQLHPEGEEEFQSQQELRTVFAPWHHPAKQVVRELQWRDLTVKLFQDHRGAGDRGNLHYFTLPGRDLLDVRVLAEGLQSLGSRISYFGFDAGSHDEAAPNKEANQSTFFAAEAELRQAGQIGDGAEILDDRLEDIAVTGSQAANRLAQKPPFDVINIDACDHLAFVPAGRTSTVFDALETLLIHQLKATKPWLLFVTTRVDPALLGTPVEKLKSAIDDNLNLHQVAFGTALANCLGSSLASLAGDLAASWTTDDLNFLKVYSVGLGKYLLHFYHAQIGQQANVELVSAYAYKVHKAKPDMLSLAFRISPHPQVQPATPTPPQPAALELGRAVKVAERASRVWDLDPVLADDEDIRNMAVTGTRKLLTTAGYDISAWRGWLAGLALRPMTVT